MSRQVFRKCVGSTDISGNSRVNDPFGERLHRSIAYIDLKTRLANAADACASVERTIACQKKYRLYREMFPDEWASSDSSLYKAGIYKNYSERANELLELIDRERFPLLHGWNDDPEAEFEQFAIFSLNFDTCCEEIYPADLRISYLAGLLIFNNDEEIWDYFSERYGLSAAALPSINSRPDESIWRTDPAPAAAPFVDLFRLVDHSTGNPWLDIINCQGGEWYPFEQETIEELAREYREATRVFEGLGKLDIRFEADPNCFMRELITLWNGGERSFLELKDLSAIGSSREA